MGLTGIFTLGRVVFNGRVGNVKNVVGFLDVTCNCKVLKFYSSRGVVWTRGHVGKGGRKGNGGGGRGTMD